MRKLWRLLKTISLIFLVGTNKIKFLIDLRVKWNDWKTSTTYCAIRNTEKHIIVKSISRYISFNFHNTISNLILQKLKGLNRIVNSCCYLITYILTLTSYKMYQVSSTLSFFRFTIHARAEFVKQYSNTYFTGLMLHYVFFTISINLNQYFKH